MKRLLFIACLLITLSAQAERITLRSGKQLRGTILVQTESVMVIQTPSGQRYQLPMDEVLSIEQDRVETDSVQTHAVGASGRPIAFRIAVSGGAGLSPNTSERGAMMGELQLGSRHIAGFPIFLGGSIGYMGCFPNPTSQFIPLQAIVALPIPLHSSEWQNGVELGASMGYAFALKGNDSGMTGSVSIGYRFCLSPQTAVVLSGVAQFAQTSHEQNETIDGIVYTHSVGSTVWLTGARISLQF